MANTTIKITQLPSIGNGLSASTILPVVNTSGTAVTEKVTVGAVANFALTQAGNTLQPAFLSTMAYSVSNAAQPNITSLGTLTGLTISNVANFHVPGGINGYVLQTDGSGNLSWVSGGGSGNGEVGGSNSQIQFNLSGDFAGDPDLTWDAGNNKLVTANFAATTAIISGNANVANINATSNVKTNAIYTDNYYYSNGQAFSGGGNGSPGGSNTQVQFNDGGAFGGNTGFTFNKTTGIFSSPFLAGNGNGLANIQGANVSGAVTYATTANTVAGGNVVGAVQYATTANSVAVANVVGIGNIATLALDGNTSNVLYGNGVFAPASGSNPFDQDLNTTDNVQFANVTSTEAIKFSNSGNIVGALGYAPTYVSIESYQSNSVNITANDIYTWSFDNLGNLTIPGTITSGNTITIDNRNSGNTADINLYSADDILIQARDRDIGSTSEGGDINIFAGDSAEDSDTSAGDIVIEAGAGGASNLDFGGGGGFVRIEAGAGGNAVGANISARSGGSLTLNAGNAGTNNGNIDLGNSGGDVSINAGDSTGNGSTGGSIILTAGTAGANALAGQIQLIIPGGDVGAGGTWTFDGEGIIQLPNSGTIGNDANNIDIGSTSAISLEASTVVNIYTDTNTAAYQWQFGDNGQLTLPTIELDVGNTINEKTIIQSQRKIIPGLRYSAEINGTTPTVVYTATSIDTTSMKVTMQIQHTGLGFEFFDVSATSTGGDTFYTVSNRVQPPTIANSTVVVDLNGSNIMEITVTINSGAANSWVTYDATEFGIAVD